MKARPDEDLSPIVSELRTGMTGNRYRPLLYVLIIALSITIPLAAFRYPQMDFSHEGAGYYVSNYTRSVVPESVVYIPESYMGEPVSVEEIGSSAFRSCDRLTVAYIAKGTEVNERSFKESPTTINFY